MPGFTAEIAAFRSPVVRALALAHLLPILVALVAPIAAENGDQLFRAVLNFRNPTIVLCVIIAVSCVHPGLRSRLFGELRQLRESAPIHESAWGRSILAFFLAAALYSCWSAYASFSLNAIDFSIFDHLFPNTARGRFMQSAAYHWKNFFGRHASWALFPILPFHRLFDHPVFLVLLHGAVWWSGGWLWWKYLRTSTIPPHVRVSMLLMYFHFPWTGAILNYGFHVEVFYLPAVFAFLLARRRDSLPWIYAASAFVLSIKEDAALYLAAFAVAWGVSDRRRAGHASLIVALSVAIFALNLYVVMPANRETDDQFLGAISKYGASPLEILKTMLLSPLQLMKDLLQGGWLRLTGNLAYLPLGSLQFWISAMPFAIIHSTSSLPLIRDGALYYSAPLVPVALAGMVWAAETRLPGPIPPQLRGRWLVAAILLGALTGGGYAKLHVVHPDHSRTADVISFIRNAGVGEKIHVQGSIFPHFPYWPELELIRKASAASKFPGWVVLHAGISPYPLEHAALLSLERELSSSPEFEAHSIGGFRVFRRKSQIPLE